MIANMAVIISAMAKVMLIGLVDKATRQSRPAMRRSTNFFGPTEQLGVCTGVARLCQH